MLHLVVVYLFARMVKVNKNYDAKTTFTSQHPSMLLLRNTFTCGLLVKMYLGDVQHHTLEVFTFAAKWEEICSATLMTFLL
jgi:hypothetical protein